MRVLRAELRPSAAPDELEDLLLVLARFRWRLGFERLLLFGLRGLIAGGAAVIALSLAAWLVARPEDRFALAAWPSALSLVAALGLAVLHWPSEHQAAFAADRRLALNERLATAAELATRLRRGGRHNRFDRLQIRDAVDHVNARVASPGWLVLERRSVQRDAPWAVVLAILALGSALVLPNLPRPELFPQDPATSANDLVQPDTLQRSLPPDVPVVVAPDAQPIEPHAPASSDLAARVQQAQAERGALDSLAQALGQVSAAQPAADAIQQGDFSGAKQQLSTLGEQADQLSDAAKQQLSRALQQAANTANQADPQLANRERQAAQALSRGTYADQRQALQNLANQVERSGARSVPADQLARDTGQLQQQQLSGGHTSGPASQAAGAQRQAPANGADANLANGQQSGGTSGPDGAGGQQNGAGTGTGPGGDPLGGAPSRLDAAGQPVSVPLTLGDGAGVRPPDGTEDQTASDPTAGARSVAEQAQAQQTGQVVPEQNLVPSERRPVVRGYFQ